ncbi:MAG: hypothetical protein Q8909_09805 [Bacteroidota bacterium]|nr:hypothetical protein [Bacteroidota bacterium]
MRKKKKPQTPPRQGDYKRFLNDIQVLMNTLKLDYNISKMSTETKRLLYHFKMHIKSHKARNEHISPKELDLINQKAQRYYRERIMDFDQFKLSNYQIQLLYCFLTVRAKDIEKETGTKYDPIGMAVKEQADKISSSFLSKYLLDNFKIVTQLCRPDHKYYGIDFYIAPFYKEDPKLEFNNDLYGFPAQKKMVDVKGHKRPAYRLAKPVNKKIIEWISVERNLLGDFYKGEHAELKVFIQTHALKRLSERLDLLDQEALNYALWENTHSIQNFEIYRNYILIPFKVYETKIGYLAVNIVDDILLISTFLFITHSYTPEGDRLTKITGLGKQDISYWHIDRLSTFVNLQEEKYPGLNQLFNKAGLGELKQLRSKEFNVDSMQTFNLDGLMEHINKSKTFKQNTF